jgi:D-alanyl-D-alanine endopeptidase (penicillin-binding protein 7)
VLVLHNQSGKALLARNADRVQAIASLTKLQAALVFIDRGLELDRGTVINRDDWRVALKGCRTRLELKWTYRNRDLLHAALMSSDNRAISALGRAVGLSAARLVEAMNQRARKNGLDKTRFRGPVGINPDNVSTAKEVGHIVREASRSRTLRQVMGTKEHRVTPMRGSIKLRYRNTNPMVGQSKAVRFLASKTGYNQQAGYCLAAVAEVRGAGEVTVVLLGSKGKQSRVRDLERTISWVRSGGRKKSP